VKVKTASMMIATSLSLLAASLAVAQNPPGGNPPPGTGARMAVPLVPIIPPNAGLPVAVPSAGGGTVTVAPAGIDRSAGGAGTPPSRGTEPQRGGQATPIDRRVPPVAPGTGARVPGPVPPGSADAAARGGTPGSVSQAGGGSLREFEPGMEYTPIPAGARITFNLQDADLPDLIRAIGNVTGRRFILGSKVRQIKATIYSPTRVTVGDAYRAFLSVLQTNGLTVVPAGRYLRVEESTGAATNALPTYAPGEAGPTDDRYITRIHRLRNMAADDASTLLGHFRSRDGDITASTATNTVIITDTAANIRRMMQILSEVDVPAVGEQIWVERVHYAPAADMARQITELLGGATGSSGGGAAGPRPAGGVGDARLTRITPDDRSNSIVIVATERMYLRVLELLRRLDVPVEGDAEVHVFYLQHADAEELATVVNNVTGGGRSGTAGGAAQPAGGAGRGGPSSIYEGSVRITADKRTNSLVITSSPRDYGAVRRIIQELDRARRQVFIEAVVMELSVRNTQKIGVNWHGGAQPDANALLLGGFQAGNSVGFPGSLLTNQDALQGLALGVRGPIIQGSQNLIPGLSLGIPGFGAVITALANSGDGDVLATPSIIATDNSPADINVGQNIPLQQNVGGSLAGATPGIPGLPPGLGLGFGGGFATPRQDVGTKIRVVPHINDSNEIRMEIEEEISEADAPVGALGAVPINKRNAKTTVVVQDQQTVVIGGLIRNSIQRGTDRIPILGDIPLIGALFRTERRTVERRNLLLFMTPYVIRDQSDLRRIFERKMRERQEFLDRYFVFSDNTDYHPLIDYARTNGIVEEVRQSIRDLRVQAEIDARAAPRTPPIHSATEPIELPPEARGRGSGRGAPTSTGPPMALPIALPANADRTVSPAQPAPQ